jgi:hypothetical protein
MSNNENLMGGVPVDLPIDEVSALALDSLQEHDEDAEYFATMSVEDATDILLLNKGVQRHFKEKNPAFLLNAAEAMQQLMPGNVSQNLLTDDQERVRQSIAIMLTAEFEKMSELADLAGIGKLLDTYEVMLFKCMFDSYLVHEQLEAAMTIIRTGDLIDKLNQIGVAKGSPDPDM